MTLTLRKLTVGMNALAAIFSLALASSASANSDHGPRTTQQQLQPAQRYSGSTPIDLNHGLPFNNGTYGVRNPEYEAWAQTPTIVPGISEKIYPFKDKENFVVGLNDRLQFFETALWNWERTTPDTKPEAAEYAKNAIEQIRPFVDKFRDSTKKAASAGQGDWDASQAEARKALVDVYGLYTHLHKNVPR